MKLRRVPIAAAACLLAFVLGGCRKWDNPYERNRPPLAPSRPLPDSGATGIDSGLVLRWTCTDPDSGDTISYMIYFGNRPDPPLAESGLAEPNWRPSSLVWLERYWWRVRAQDNWLGSTDGPLWTFTMAAENHAPFAPHSPVPESGATDRSNRMVLRWSASDPDSLDVLQYDIRLGTSLPLPTVAESLGDTFFRVSGLQYGAQYLWQVVARDNRRAATPGPVWRFATMSPLRIDAPKSGDRIRMLSNYTIRYSGGPAAHLLDSTVLYYTLDGSSWVRLGQPVVGGQFAWTVPGAVTASGGVQVRVWAEGDTWIGSSGAVVIYDTLRPTSINVTVPNALSRWNVGSSYTIRWTGGTDGMDSSVVFYSADSGMTWQRQGSTKQPGQFAWIPSGPASTKARVRVVAHCRADTASGTSVAFAVIEPPYPDSLLPSVAVGVNPSSLCFDSLDNRVFCALRGGDELVAISGQTNAVVGRVAVGPAPSRLLWTPDPNRVYCATDSGTLAVVDPAALSVRRIIAVGRMPSALCYDPVRKRVWVANSGDSTVTVVDCAGDSVVATVVVGRNPRAVVYSRTADRVYVSDSMPGRVSVINCGTLELVASVPLSLLPYSLLVDESNNIIWAAGRTGNALCPIDGATNQPLAPVIVGREPWVVLSNPVRGRVYSLNAADNNVSVIDGVERRVVMGLPVGNQPRSGVYARQAGKLYVANWGAGSVTIIDGAGDRVIRFINIDSRPVDICYNSVSNKVYAANSQSGTVSIIVPR